MPYLNSLRNICLRNNTITHPLPDLDMDIIYCPDYKSQGYMSLSRNDIRMIETFRKILPHLTVTVMRYHYFKIYVSNATQGKELAKRGGAK